MKTITPPIQISDKYKRKTSPMSSQSAFYAFYKCHCGNKFECKIADVKIGHSKSCGCYIKARISECNTTHGLSEHRLYKTWYGMIRRTTDENFSKYKYYGGRGISVCGAWMMLENFISDMNDSYERGLTLDRINNNGNYEKNNCRWSTQIVQMQNSRKLRSDNTSGYRGVTYAKHAKKWCAVIWDNKKKIHLGYFTESIDAAKAYDTYVKQNGLEHTTNGVI